LLPLFHELLRRRLYPHACQHLRRLIEANPDVSLYADQLPVLRDALAKQAALGEVSEATLAELEARFTPWGAPEKGTDPELETERRSAFQRLRTEPLHCGSWDRSPQDGSKLEGGWRLSVDDAHDSERPLVSVVTVCFNAEASIDIVVRSVMAQSHSAVEHIIVDGGSSDGTVDRLQNFGDQVAYWVSEPDGGIYSAMNKGLRLARGRYIALLNADDRLHPEFVERSVALMESSGADITFCDYETENGVVDVLYPHDGILFSQLDIKHNTFLFRRECFETVGEFDEDRKYVSDARWNRGAWLAGLRFAKTNGALVFYSTQGASSSQTQKVKEELIDESATLVQLCFPFLDRSQARRLYLSNFNTHHSELLLELRRRPGLPSLFQAALELFQLFNIAERPGYLARMEHPAVVQDLIGIASAFDLPLGLIRTDGAPSALRRALSRIEWLSREVAASSRPVVLHFARKFSSPSETFIHDLLRDYDRRDSKRLHIMLCDERLLEKERPYDKVVTIPWDDLDDGLRRFLYRLLWERLKPSLVIAHFALNGFWLFQRLDRECWETPSIFMCHGVDVFALSRPGGYARFIREFAADASNVVFTVVSGFLGQALEERGVPRRKIFTVPNAVSDRFHDHRKQDGFYRGGRPLEILNIGRLIGWKGHHVLLEALAGLRNDRGIDVRLTVVYGNSGDRLDELEAMTASLGLEDAVTWVPFVDLAAEPGYLAGFDLFVLPSTVHESSGEQSETFGVSILEAISAGLPVIGSTAGGIPEVVGEEGPHARIVPHGDPNVLEAAVAEWVQHPERVFTDNLSYAQERLGAFSSANRYRRWREAEQSLYELGPVVYHFCALGRGGAAGSSMNIHRGLLRRGWDSRFVTRAQEKERLPRYLPNIRLMEPEFSFDFQQSQSQGPRPGKTMFSVDEHIVSNETLLDLVADADLVNLTWIARFLSVENIAAISATGIPLVITVRDMYPITGGCHYFHGCERYKSGCDACPQIPDVSDNYPYWVLKTKQELWRRQDMSYVALSEHTEKILRQATLSRDCRIDRIPNFVDFETFYPAPAENHREELLDGVRGFVIGYLPSFNSEAKGHEPFLQALRLLHREQPDLELTVAWISSGGGHEDRVPFPVIRLNHIEDKAKLRDFYNAVDVVAVPSTEETFSNTTTEALACGSAVIGFKTGVLAELPEDRRIAGAVPVGDVRALAEQILRFHREGVDREACRAYVSKHFEESAVIDQYATLFKRRLHEALPSRRPDRERDARFEWFKRMRVRKSKGAGQRLADLRRSIQHRK
jgi:glycosyltransferase involved in cell wall biosynthesis